jgi:hypothetical protein
MVQGGELDERANFMCLTSICSVLCHEAECSASCPVPCCQSSSHYPCATQFDLILYLWQNPGKRRNLSPEPIPASMPSASHNVLSHPLRQWSLNQYQVSQPQAWPTPPAPALALPRSVRIIANLHLAVRVVRWRYWRNQVRSRTQRLERGSTPCHFPGLLDCGSSSANSGNSHAAKSVLADAT